MNYGCHLYNFGICHWFKSYDEALVYGQCSGFQFTVIDTNFETVQ